MAQMVTEGILDVLARIQKANEDTTLAELERISSYISRFSGLVAMVDELGADLRSGTSWRRTDALHNVVLPLLRPLGWDLSNRRIPVFGLRTASGTVDLALRDPVGTPAILIKVGTPLDIHGSEHGQSGQNGVGESIQVTVSNDGREWQFHLAGGWENGRGRDFVRFDLAHDDHLIVAETLDNYLAFHRVKSGRSLEEAKQADGKRQFISAANSAWRRSLLESDILERFQEEMLRTTGVALDRKRAYEFIRGQFDAPSWEVAPPAPKRLQAVAPAAPKRRRTVAPHDAVRIYDLVSQEVVTHVVVDENPDLERGEVSRESPMGQALLGAHEGQERDVWLDGGEPRAIRIELIERPASGSPDG